MASKADKWADQEFERVPGIRECNPNDHVALEKARRQWVRDRAVDREEIQLLRWRMIWCQRREDVNAPQRCRELTEAYLRAFNKYKSKGLTKHHGLMGFGDNHQQEHHQEQE